MKLSINRKDFLETFSIASAVVNPKSPKPILQNVKVAADKSLGLFATDLEMGIELHLTTVEIIEPGTLVLPPSKILNILREVQDEKIELTGVKEEGSGAYVCTVTSSDSVFKILCEDPDEFPAIGEEKLDFSDNNVWEIETHTLLDMVSKTIFATAVDSPRYALNGVLFVIDGDSITLVATDGRRLAQVKGKLRKPEGAQVPANVEVIVPVKMLNELGRAAQGMASGTEKDGVLRFKIDESQVYFRTDSVGLVSRLIDGKFPPYNEVIPKDNDKKVVLETSAFLSAVRKAAILTSELSNAVDLTFSKGKLVLASRTPEAGEATITLDIDYDYDEVTISFNPDFLKDVLRVAGDEITVFLKDARTQALLKSDKNYSYIIMPVVTMEE